MLPYDQIPADHRTILDIAPQLGDEGHAGMLNFALAVWAARDDSKPDGEARRAANTAMDEIDAMLRELHALRNQLIDETRASDDATDARADALLAAGKAAAR